MTVSGFICIKHFFCFRIIRMNSDIFQDDILATSRCKPRWYLHHRLVRRCLILSPFPLSWCRLSEMYSNPHNKDDSLPAQPLRWGIWAGKSNKQTKFVPADLRDFPEHFDYFLECKCGCWTWNTSCLSAFRERFQKVINCV